MVNLVATNAKEAVVASMVGYGRVCVLWMSRVWQSIFYWCFWQESGFRCHENVFIFDLLYK